MAKHQQQPRLRGVAHGDPHLERFSSQYFKNLIGNPDDLYIQSIERCCDYAVRNDLEHVFLLGDIADHPNPKQETIIRLIGVFNKYKKLRFWIITGNHDITARGKNGMIVCEFLANVELLSNVKVYTQPKMEIIDGLAVYFMPFGFNEQPKGAYLGIGHHSVTGATFDSGYPVGDEGINISNKKAYWIMGHLHEWQSYDWGTYIGTAYQINFGESMKKYYAEIDARLEGSKVTAEVNKLNVELPYRLKTIRAKKDDDLLRVKPFDPKKKIFYRVIYGPDMTLPKTFQTDNAHILDCTPVDAKTGNELKITSATLAPEEALTLSPTKGLMQYLMQKGLEKKRAKAATRFVKTLL